MSKPDIFIYLFLTMLFASSCSEQESSSALINDKPVSVNVIKIVTSEGYSIQQEYVGVIQAKEEASLGLELSGKVKEIFADVGDSVKAGDRLISLDTELLETETGQLKAQQSQIIAQLTLNKTTLKRQRSLKQKGFSADAEIDNLISQRDALRAQYQQIQASIEADLLRIEKSTLLAPYAGKISQRFVSVGDVVSMGTPTLTLLTNNAQEALIGLPKKEVTSIYQKPNWPIRVGRDTFTSTLINQGANIDTNSRTVNLRFAIPAQSLSGEIAYLQVKKHYPLQGYWIPITAITDGVRGTWNVFAINDEQRVERRTIQLIHTADTKAYVTGAIKGDELLIADGLHRLVPGQRASYKTPAAKQSAEAK